MGLRDEAADCLKAHAGKVVTATTLAKLVVARQPNKYREKLQRSTRIKTLDELSAQVRSEIAAEHWKLLAAYPQIRSALQGKRTRTYEWRDS